MSRKSKYERDLRRMIADADSWPEFPGATFLARLNKVADEAITKKTIEGNLAAILIYHQLAEDMLRLLLRDCEFYIRLAVFPARITFPARRKQMFGQLQQSITESIDFPGKEQLFEKCNVLNQLRIAIVHKLPQRESFTGLRRQTLRASRLHEQIYTLFDHAHDFFRVCFHDFRKNL